MSETDEIAENVRGLLIKAGWAGRQLSWAACRKIARVLMPDETVTVLDNFAASLRRL